MFRILSRQFYDGRAYRIRPLKAVRKRVLACDIDTPEQGTGMGEAYGRDAAIPHKDISILHGQPQSKDSGRHVDATK